MCNLHWCYTFRTELNLLNWRVTLGLHCSRPVRSKWFFHVYYCTYNSNYKINFVVEIVKEGQTSSCCRVRGNRRWHISCVLIVCLAEAMKWNPGMIAVKKGKRKTKMKLHTVHIVKDKYTIQLLPSCAGHTCT